MNLTKNTGLLIGERPEDYRFGSTSPIKHEVRNSTKDWRPFRSRDERQNLNGDRMHCVSASATNIWEQQANWMLVNNLWDVDALKFWNAHGYIVNGKFEVSRRFTAKMSGTTKDGNYFYKVWDSVRKDGMVPDSAYGDDTSLNWDQYYAPIPTDLILLGKESLKYFNALYESISPANVSNMQKFQEMAPLQFGITTQCGWNAEVPLCNTQPNHAVDNDHIRADTSYDIFDSYDPYSKHLPKGYNIPLCYRAILYPIKRAEPIVQTFEKDLHLGETSEDVKRLQQVLKVVDVPTGYYGNMTRAKVWEFQKSHGLGGFWEQLFWRGSRVDESTRKELNKLKI